MADKNKPPASDNRSSATTKPALIRLNQVVLVPERFCNRDPADLKKDNLTAFADTIAAEGLQTPVEFYRDKNGQLIITKGHRRISALRLNASRQVPGFAPDTPFAVEVVVLDLAGIGVDDSRILPAWQLQHQAR